MNQKILTLLWLAAVVAISAMLLSWLEDWGSRPRSGTEDPSRTALVMLIGYAGEKFPGSENADSYKKVGCDDSLVRYEIPVVSKRLASVLSALSEFDPPEGLHNPMAEKGLSVSDVRDEPRQVVVNMEGDPKLGGVCDAPRLKGQIEETIKLYVQEFAVELNGSEKDYECFADVWGRCAE